MKNNINKWRVINLNILVPVLLIILSMNLFAQDVLNLSPNSIFYISPNAQVGVMGNVNISNNAFLETNADNLVITGDLNNSGSFTCSATVTLAGDINNSNSFSVTNGMFILDGSVSQTFTSPDELTLHDLVLTKSGGDLELDIDLKIDNNIYMLSSTNIELFTNNLTVDADGGIYTDYNNSESFTASRCISNSSGTLGGALIYEINAGSPIQEYRTFPLGTPGVYTPGKITLNNCDFNAGAYYGMRVIDIEHPRVEKSPASLTKYWNVFSDNIDISDNGADLIFYYDPAEVDGNESAFIVMYYKPGYPDPAGYWRVDPGLSNQVAWWGNYRFYTQETDSIDGDWTAGEEVAAISTYYSRADGDYNDNNTWSKDFFGGPVSNTIPNKQSDRVRISNNSVTITEVVAPANIVSVEAGAELVFTDNYYIHGDTARFHDDSKVVITHENGITASTMDGNIRNAVRDLSQNVIYEYSGTFTAQQSGNGLPSNIRCLMINKPSSKIMVMNKIIEIIDSLVITSGSLDIGSYSINGKSSGRDFIMREGELIVRGAFPVNYDPPTFTSGTITFWKDGNNTYVNIPSTASTPAAVNQYKTLVIKGNRTGASAVTFSNAGETVINGIFDISNLEFDTSIPRFNTDGSVVVFNQDGGTQQIPCSPGSVPDSIRNIQYYNLRIEGTGRKELYSPFTPTFVIVNDFTLESSTFTSNGYNLEVNQNWINTGGIFDPETDAVIFNSPIQIFTNYITSRSVADNPFYNVVISGTGEVQPTDNMLVNKDIKFLSGSRMTMTSSTTTLLDLNGNWINLGGTFSPGSSTVSFTGTTSQTMSNTADSENFNTLKVDNAGGGLIATSVGIDATKGVYVDEYLDLSGGILYVRGRFAQIENDIIREGATPGHVDGSLRKTIVTGSSSNTFSVGYGPVYTPVVMELNGTGGAEGIIDVLSDTLTTTTTPIATTGAALTPAGSNIEDTKNIRRQFPVTIPSSSTFSLGNNRTYNANLNFVPGADPIGDVRGGADYDQFDVRLWTGIEWIGPDRYGTPRTGTRTSSSTQFSLLSDLGTFVIGEPEHLSFYSIDDGNWSTVTNWSTQHYYGTPTTIVPTNDAYIYVGNSHTITVDGNKTIDGFVWIDSLGTLMTGTNVLSGVGDFYLFAEGALGIGHANGISTPPTATGNIQTTNRDYNVSTHNRGHFIYTDATDNQPTGDGLPTTVATLTVDKTPATALRLTNDIVITDSLSIPSGILLAQEPATAIARDIELNGNLNIGTNGEFDPYQGEFLFISNASQTVTSVVDIDFYDLTLINTGVNKKIWFLPNSSGMNNITIGNQLIFAPTNKAYIDLSPTNSTITRAPVYNSGEWVITIDQAALGVARLGEGHISGEIRKWVPINNFIEIMYEVGHDSIYSPFAFDLDDAGGTAGYVGTQVIPIFHPEGDYLDDAAYNYQRARMIQKYWRLTRPATSSFAQGGRDMAFRARYRDPEDIPGGALKRCFDITYWKGGLNSNWQRLSPPDPDPFNLGNSAEFNDASTSTCGDRIIVNNEATYRTVGTDTSTTAHSINGGIRTLANFNLALASNNRFLLGDFMVGQQGPAITYYYSKNNGAWNDPNTWVTYDLSDDAGYSQAANATGSWPKRRLDVAKIGNGKTVNLNCNIGSGYAGSSGTNKFFEQRLGSCIVEETAGGKGKLILNTFQIRASVFELHSGGILSSGAEDGFHEDLSRGNIIRQYENTTIARDFNFDAHDNGNFEFTALGQISDTYLQTLTNENYCNVSGGWSNGERYIDDIYIDEGAAYATPDVFTFENTGSARAGVLTSASGFRYYCDTTMRFTAGNQYTMRINTGGLGATYFVVMWLDTDFDGTFDDDAATEEFPVGGVALGGGGFTDVTFTIPANAPTGTTRMRVKLRKNAIQASPCNTGGTTFGEVEDYTVFISKAGYTMDQLTGGGIPAQIASVTVNTNHANSTVTQTSGLSVSNELLIENGTFIPTTYPAITTDFLEYSMSAENDTYSPLTGATTPVLSGGGNPNDGYYSGIPIGFDFPYLGTVYTTVGASTNGFLSFGTVAAEPVNDLDANGSTARPLIAPLWDDLDMTSGQFSYQTVGVSPDRTFIAQWQDAEWSEAAGSPVISFQCKLHESTGGFEFHYSNEATAVNAGSASIGATSTATGADNFVSFDGTGVAPGVNTTTSTNNLSTKPADGQVYLMEPTNALLKLQGDFTNNATTTSMGGGTEGTIEFDGSSDQEIRGSSTTDFYNMVLNNDEESIVLMTNARVNNWMTFKDDNFLELNENNITFSTTAGAISSYSGTFDNDRMILSSSSATVGSIIKEFTTVAGEKSYFFPVGVDNVYNPADISVIGTYVGTPSIAISLYSGLHPARLKDEMLSKYWNLDLTDISNITSNTFTFVYHPDHDVNGNNARYIPSLFQTNDEWEINVGMLPKAYPNPIEIENTPYIEGDWTAGEADVFFIGRVFYSINSGVWSESTNWSNDKILQHNGPPSSYYPSELYVKDTVILDGHLINYDLEYGIIDTMKIGGANLGIINAGRGVLDFEGTAIDRQTLEIDRNIEVAADGTLNSSTIVAGGRRDTLIVNGSIFNEADGTAGIDGGFYFNQGNNDYVILKFAGDASSTVTGEGYWGNPLVEVHLDKENGLADTLTCHSNAFADATGTDPFLFYLLGGVLTLSESSSSLSLPSATLTLSSGTNEVTMDPYSGINVLHGLMRTKQTLNTNIFTTINVNGGILEVGDQIDEPLLYQTGSYVSVEDGLIDVAGCFEKLANKYVIDMSIGSSGVFRVLNKGNTNIANKAFNVSNESSTFSMDGGRVIIAQSSNSSSNDYEVSSGFGLGMINGATVQIGDSIIAPPAQSYKIAGTTPMFNLHYVGDATTNITQQNLFINNDWTIDDTHLAELNDNTVYLGGNFLNSGIFNSHSADLTTDARQLILTGSSNTQTIYNEDATGLDLYNLRINKAGGEVLLGTDNSFILVRNTLEFALNNEAVINAATNSQYVEMSPAGSSNPLVSRNGLGHVNGLMYRYFTTGNLSKKFDVGGDTASSSYRPVTIETVGAGGTAGLIGVMPYNYDHSELANSTIKPTTNVPRYWNLSYLAPFDLGARTYKITTQWVNPGDLQNSPNLIFFEHGFYSPPLPSGMPPSEWTYPQVSARSDTTVTTVNNTLFGDYVAGEPLGVFFYSYNSGDWYDANTWSMDSYTTKTTIIDHLPGQGLNDFVKIGNGKRVSLPAGGPYPTLKSVEVEIYNDLPGEFYIGGEIGYVKGDRFVLEDSCTIAVQNLTGLEWAGNNGAVRMSVNPFYGTSRYMFNSSYGPQISGKAMPGLVKSLLVDNTTSAPNNRVFISTFAGAPDVQIIDSLFINNGELNCGNRNIHLYGNMYMLNNAIFDPLSKDFSFESSSFTPAFHRLVLGNDAGVNFYNLNIPDLDLLVSTEPTLDIANSHIYIENILTIDNPSDLVINVRDNARKVVIQNGATLTRTQNTGYIDGILQKPVGAGAGSYLFEIGNSASYTPAIITFDAGAGGTAGAIDGVNYSPVPLEPTSGNRMDPNKSVPRYWSMTAPTGSSFVMGARTFNLNLQFPAMELLPVNTAKAAVRRKSIPAESPLWSSRWGGDLVWNNGLASVQLSPLPTVQWPGLGEFYVGEKLPRTFYSRQTGVWSDNNTWTFDPSHIGTAAPDGDIPNMDESELNDNVEVGLDHIVSLDLAESKIDTLKVKHDSKLDMITNRINCFDCPSSGLFILSENGTISFADLSTPSSTGTMLNFASYVCGPTSTIEFYGTQTLPTDPFGLPQYDGNVLINLPGTKLINTPLIIYGNLTISNSALLLINNIDAARVLSNVINEATLENHGVLEIGTP